MEAPILLITFNRPECTKQVFKKIQKRKVKKLYFFNDGPRKGNESDRESRREIKKLVDKIDWNCDLHVNFQDHNLGCGSGPATAISWAFENEDKLIILEDDCVPSMSFFDYCNHCLNKYYNDNRIWVISGNSYTQDDKFFKNKDYIFSQHVHTWGWATWKRCWKEFDIEMSDFPDFLNEGGALNICISKEEGVYYNKKYQKLYLDKNLSNHAWDYQFCYTILKNGGLSIVPAKNLVKNIGYFGTHAKGKHKYHEYDISNSYQIINEPQFIMVNREYEIQHFRNHKKNSLPLYKKILNKFIKITKFILGK